MVLRSRLPDIFLVVLVLCSFPWLERSPNTFIMPLECLEEEWTVVDVTEAISLPQVSHEVC